MKYSEFSKLNNLTFKENRHFVHVIAQAQQFQRIKIKDLGEER
jgi:hypothetical protein